jgi:DNA-binding HxlR family transcriptional regulator
MYEKKIPMNLDCGVEITQRAIGGKWRPYVIDYITRGFHRPSDLQEEIPCITKRVLHQTLSDLLDLKIVRKEVYDEMPPRVEYYLTERGESLVPIIRMMHQWGTKHHNLYDDLGAVRKDDDPQE